MGSICNAKWLLLTELSSASMAFLGCSINFSSWAPPQLCFSSPTLSLSHLSAWSVLQMWAINYAKLYWLQPITIYYHKIGLHICTLLNAIREWMKRPQNITWGSINLSKLPQEIFQFSLWKDWSEYTKSTWASLPAFLLMSNQPFRWRKERWRVIPQIHGGKQPHVSVRLHTTVSQGSVRG